ncbi:MAG: VOC family protein [Actinobacteria bacterium]|nr:VOC family protein [Actinomycetota bacterium]
MSSDQRSPDWARPVVYFSIEARDAEAQRAFYRELFNWGIGDGPIMQISTGPGAPEAGINGHINAGSTPRVSIYVQVRDIRATLARAVELGGSVVFEPYQIPGAAMIATITDPEGNTVGIVQQ